MNEQIEKKLDQIEKSFELQEQLDKLVKKIQDNNCSIRAIWCDEYGGQQSVRINNSDKLTVETM